MNRWDDYEWRRERDERWRRRQMVRGDSLAFVLQVFANLVTGELRAVDQGCSPPPGQWVPQNLTGCRVLFTAKNNYADIDGLAVAQCDNQSLGGVVVSNLSTAAVTMPAMATAQLGDHEFHLVYDVRVKTTASAVQTVDRGEICVSPSVPRSV